MSPLFTSMARALRGRETPPPAGREPMITLLLGEVAWAIGQALRPARLLVAAPVAVLVGLLLGPTTPGPVLGAGWRLTLGVLLGFAAMSVSHQLLQQPPADHDVPADLRPARVALATVVMLTVGTFVITWLLAAVTGAPSGATGGGLEVSLSIDGPVLIVSALLLAGVLVAGLGHRLAVPTSLLFLGLGMVVGSDVLGWVIVDDPEFIQSIAIVALIIILFDGGLSTTPTDLRLGLGPGLALATVGVGVTAGVTAAVASLLLDVPPRLAWLLGAVVASTDASAVFAVLRRVPVPRRIAAILQLESGANDPVAVLLTVGLLAAWDVPADASSWVAFGLVQLLGGVVVGGMVGLAGGALARRIDLGTVALFPILAVTLAGCAYGAATAVGASGFLATFFAGIVLAIEAPRRRILVVDFVGTLAAGVEVGLFLLLGLLVFPAQLLDVAGEALIIAIALVVLARPIGTALSLAWFSLRKREIAAISWLGMRGAVPIVLATLAFSAGIEEASLVFDVIFFVVLLSSMLQGLTAQAVLRWLRLGDDVPAADPAAVAMPLDAVGIDVLEVTLGLDDAVVGRSLADAPTPRDLLVVGIVRNGVTLVPRGGTVLRPGDRLVVTAPARGLGAAALADWTGTDVEVRPS